MKKIEFDKEKYDALKLAYAHAVADKKDSFISEGSEFVTIQAKVMLEPLKPIYERTPNLNWLYEPDSKNYEVDSFSKLAISM